MTELTSWHWVHFWLIGMWAGLICGEMVIEIATRIAPGRLRYAVARFHHKIDMFVETPLLVAVLGSGLVLTMRTHHDAYLGIKIAAGLAVIAINLFCVVVVVKRSRAAEADATATEALDRLTVWVFRSFYAGFPLAVIATYMGGHRVGWW